MSRDLVGFENLPNAFIKEIEVFDHDAKTMKITVKVCVYDSKENPMWYDTSEMLTKMMKVGLFFSLDESVSEEINIGNIALSDLNYDSKSLPGPSMSHDNFVFKLHFEKIIPKDTKHLNLYCFCVIEKQKLGENYGLPLDKPYSGPIKSERVFKDFKLVNTTMAFLLPNGEFWPGPVHAHNGNFMVGSYHTDEAHSPLDKITVQNTKLKDYRAIDNRRRHKNQETKNFISDLLVSYNSNTDINALFMLNTKTVLLSNTKFGSFLNRASKSIFQRLLGAFKINLMTVQRQRVKIIKRNNRQQTQTVFSKKNIIKTGDSVILRNTTRFERNGPFDLIVPELRSNRDNVTRREGEIFLEELSDYKKIAMIKELFFEYGNEIRTFQFNDYELTDTTPGDYQYKVDFQFTDPTYKFLVETIAVLKQTRSNLKILVGLFSRGKYTVEDTEGVQDVIDTYVENYSYIYDISDTEKQKLSEQMFTLINPVTATMLSMKQFEKNYEDLLSEFLFFLEYNPYKSFSGGQKVSITSKSETTARILISKTFSRIVQPSSNAIGFGYMDSTTLAEMKIISKSFLREKAVKQMNKNFSQQPSIDSPDLDESTNLGLNDTSTYMTTYWSPINVKTSRKLFKIGLDSTAPYGLYNTILGIRPMGDTSSGASTTEETGVTVEQATTEQQTSDTQFIDSSEIIGENQQFVTYAEVADSYNVIETESAASEKFHDFFSGFQNNRTFTAVLGDTKKLSGPEAQKLPNQLKAVIHGQSAAAKTNYISSGTDLLANPKTKNYYEMNNFSVQKLIYIDGFLMDSQKNVLLNKPIYKEMSLNNFETLSKPVVCFLQAYTNNIFKITDEKKVSVVDSFFIMSDKDISVRTDTTAAPQELPIYIIQEISFEFMNSNTVVQKNNPMIQQAQVMNNEATTEQITSSPPNRGSRQNTSPGSY